MASIVLDDSTTNLKFGGGTWSGILMDRFFGGSAAWPAFALNDIGDTGVYGSLSFAFRGTSVAFFGNTPGGDTSQWVMVSIDGGEPYNTSYMDPVPPTSRQWYQSPLLQDVPHNVNISHIAGTSVDFIVVTAGRDTPLSGQKLIVDDTDGAIAYDGEWSQVRGMYSASDGPVNGFPYGNSTHQSGTPGASATFRFAGTSVALYGVFSWQTLGSLSMVYTLDGYPVGRTYNVTSATLEYRIGIRQRENFLFFSNDSLAPGEHILKIGVSQATGQYFSLDYALYSPSFNTLASKPVFPSTSTPTTTAPGSTLTPTRSPNKGAQIGAIVGGILGGLILILAILMFFWRRRTAARNAITGSADDPPPVPTHEAAVLQPFISISAGRELSNNAPMSKTAVPGRRPAAPRPRMPQHKPALPASFSPAAAAPPAALQVAVHADTAPSDGDGGSGGDAGFRGRMHRLQDLVLELNGEMEEGEGADAARVAELRGRIAELTRRDVGGRVARLSAISSVAPPAYESR